MSKFMSAANVFLDLDIKSREEMLEFLSRKAVELGLADSVKETLSAFKFREEEGTTGLTNGFAIPHAKDKVIKSAGVVVARTKEPMDWPSFDDQPVDICIALYVPEIEAGTTHLKLLSQTAVLLMKEEFREAVRRSADPAAIAMLINEGLEG
nr:fructose PTS transporter subunit IIA [uncultured Olsenella sp.]